MGTWYVEHPIYLYKENVKELAKKAGLKVVDSCFQGENKQCADAPKLTKVKEKEATKAE